MYSTKNRNQWWFLLSGVKHIFFVFPFFDLLHVCNQCYSTASHRHGLLLHTYIVACVVCLVHGRALQKRLNRSRVLFAVDSCARKEPAIRWSPDHPHGIGHFWGKSSAGQLNVVCDGDAAFRQITLDSCLVFNFSNVFISAANRSLFCIISHKSINDY